MESSVLLVVCFEDSTFNVRVGIDWSIAELKRQVCLIWSKLSPSLFELVFERELKRHVLDSDFDLQSLVCFSTAKGLNYVNVSVSLKQASTSLVVTREMGASSSLCSGVYNEQVENYISVAKVDVLTGVGQKFKGGAPEFRIQLLRHCVMNGYKVKMLKNDPTRVTAECALKSKTGCLWRVHASRKFNMPQFFEIKTMVTTHTCGAGYKDLENPLMSSKLVKSIVVDMVSDKPALKPQDIIDHFRRELGVKLTYYFAYKGRELALVDIHGGEEVSYHQLEWYVNELKKTNPGSHVVLEKDPVTNKFERVFISFSACVHGFNFLRPMIFLDGTFLKGKYKGCLYAATAKNGNRGIFPLAIAVVISENNDNWIWFMENLKIAIGNERRITFVSDRHRGLLVSIPRVFPNSYHAYCLWHLENNLRTAIPKKKPNRGLVIGLFHELACVATHIEFEELYQQIKEAGVEEALNFIANIPLEHWSNAHFLGNRYGELSSALAEVFNSWIIEERNLPITALIDKLRLKFMKMMSTHRELAMGWTTMLCPKMEEELAKRIDAGRSLTVVKSSDFVFEVLDVKSCRVNLLSRQCTCNKWKVDGFPCVHAVRCIMRSGKDVYSFCEIYFSTSYFRQCYSRSIEPVPNEGMPFEIVNDASILPPDTRRAPGRPQKSRRRVLVHLKGKRFTAVDASHMVTTTNQVVLQQFEEPGYLIAFCYIDFTYYCQ